MLVRQPSRLTVKKEKKASEEDLQPPSSVWPNKPTFKNVTFHFMNSFRESSTGKFVKNFMTRWRRDGATRLLTSSWSQQSAALISRIFISSSDLTEKTGRMTESSGRITKSRFWIPTWRRRISELKTKKNSNDPVLNWTESKEYSRQKGIQYSEKLLWDPRLSTRHLRTLGEHRKMNHLTSSASGR